MAPAKTNKSLFFLFFKKEHAFFALASSKIGAVVKDCLTAVAHETRDGPAGGALRCAAGAAAGDGGFGLPCDLDVSSLKLAPRRRQKCPSARGLFAWVTG
jgi:hypothetical protein